MSEDQTTTLAGVGPCPVCEGTGHYTAGHPERELTCHKCGGSGRDYMQAFREATITLNVAMRDGHVDPEELALDAMQFATDAIREEVRRYAETSAAEWCEGMSGYDEPGDYAHASADSSGLVIYTNRARLVGLLAEDEDAEEAREILADGADMIPTLAYCVIRRAVQEAIDRRVGVDIDGHGTIYPQAVKRVEEPTDDGGYYVVVLNDGDTVQATDGEMEALREAGYSKEEA